MSNTELEVLSALVTRRHSSHGPFDPSRKIRRSTLDRMFEAARWAPTMANSQNFHIVAIQSEEVLGQIAQLSTTVSENFLKENYQHVRFSADDLKAQGTGVLASKFPPAWVNPEAWNPECDIRTQLCLLRSFVSLDQPLLILAYDGTLHAPGVGGGMPDLMGLGCVVQNMWLTATAEEIGMRMLTIFANEDLQPALRTILGLPASFQVACGIALGYEPRGAVADVRVRRNLAQFIHRDVFANAYTVPEFPVEMLRDRPEDADDCLDSQALAWRPAPTA